MTPTTLGMLAVLALLLFLRVPIAVSLVGSAVFGLVADGIPVSVVLQRFYAGTESWVLMAIPFFILAGVVMEYGGLGRRLVTFCNACVGFLRGGLANVNVVASMVFGGISGSAVADTSALGSVLIPAMERQGYSKTYSAAITAASSPIGMIIPPSIPMVMWSFVSGVSLGALFLAGILPGILVTLGLMLVSTWVCVRRGYQATPQPFRWDELRLSLKDGLFALVAPLIIIGGIMTGVFTPTEAGVVAVAYSILVTSLVYREFSLRQVPKVLIEAGRTAASVMFVVAGATVFSWVLAFNQVPQAMGAAILSWVDEPWQFVLVGSILFFILGMLLDTTTVILLVGPILAPIIPVMGLDPVHVALVFLVILAAGLVTPPVGLCLFVASSLTGDRVEAIAREAIPFVAVIVLVAAVVWLVPGTVTWVGALMG